MVFVIFVIIIVRLVLINISIVVLLVKDLIIGGISIIIIVLKVVRKEFTRVMLGIGSGNILIKMRLVLRLGLVIELVIFVIRIVDGVGIRLRIVYNVRIIGFCLICIISVWRDILILQPVHVHCVGLLLTTCAKIPHTT